MARFSLGGPRKYLLSSARSAGHGRGPGAGEAINSVSTGDNLRWSVEAVVSGEGPTQQPHLIVKPFDRGLMTSVIVTTTRRTYRLNLRSTDYQYMHAVSFTYPGEPQTPATPAQAKA